MTKSFKRIIALILVAVMIVVAFPENSYAKSATSVTVTNQTELKAALADKSVKKITIKSGKSVTLTVKSGKYTKVALVINAPKATISNSGVFKSVTVNDAKKYEEKTSGNTITVKDSKLTVSLDKKAKVKSLTLDRKNANINLSNSGKITNLEVNGKTKLTATQNGTLTKLSINAKSGISISGKTKSTTNVAVNKAAQGTTITTTVPLKLKTVTIVSLNYGKSILDTLKNTEIFSYSAIEHIFVGQVNSMGKAVGYHYEGIENTAGKVIAGTECIANDLGVYQAQVEVNGILKSVNYGYSSSFFPKNMNPQEVVNSINQAYNDRVLIRENRYRGISNGGIEIEMFLDNNNKITSAFPIY